MFQDRSEELQRLQTQLMEEEEEELWEAPSEEIPAPEELPVRRSNRALLITVLSLCLGIVAVFVYLYIRFGGFFL